MVIMPRVLKIAREVHYGHIHNLRDSHITALTLEGRRMLVDRSTEVAITECCIMGIIPRVRTI